MAPGTLHVTLDLGLRVPYHGSVPLVSGEIAEDLASYLVVSHQIPSVVALGVLVAPTERVMAAGGVIVQVMPGTDERAVSYLEQRAKALPAGTSMISGGHTPGGMGEAALGGVSSQGGERGAVRFRCRCSRRKVQRVLISFGETELREILAEQGRIGVRCNFFAARYVFDQKAAQNLISGVRNGNMQTRERGNGWT